MTSPSVLARIRARLPTLPPSDAKVAVAILDDPVGTIHMTVSQLAERAGTAESTAIRCCAKLGFRGFQDLKLNLARENPPSHHDTIGEIRPDDKADSVFIKVMQFMSRVMSDAASNLDPVEFARSVDVLSEAREILILGFGESYKVAVDAQDRFSSIGLRAFAPNDSNLKFVRSHCLGPDDCCLLISHSGATRDLTQCAEIVRQVGGKTIGLTGSPRSRLAQLVDHPLIAGGRDLKFRFEAISGRLVHLAVIDALYVALMTGSDERSAKYLRLYEDIEASWQL